MASAIGYDGNAAIVKLQLQRVLMRVAGDDRIALRFAATYIGRAEFEEQRISSVVPAGAEARIPGQRIQSGDMRGLAAGQAHIQVREVERAGFAGQPPVVSALGDHAGAPQELGIVQQSPSVLEHALAAAAAVAVSHCKDMAVRRGHIQPPVQRVAQPVYYRRDAKVVRDTETLAHNEEVEERLHRDSPVMDRALTVAAILAEAIHQVLHQTCLALAKPAGGLRKVRIQHCDPAQRGGRVDVEVQAEDLLALVGVHTAERVVEQPSLKEVSGLVHLLANRRVVHGGVGSKLRTDVIAL